jgi:hypothetical protein
LFPLHTVLFPGGVLPLKIFEARYLGMVSACMKAQTGFVVLTIEDGRDTGGGASCYATGCEARIEHWEQRPDGLLGIIARGERRVRVGEVREQSDQLLTAEVEDWPLPENDARLPDARQSFGLALRELHAALGAPFTELQGDYGAADWVSRRLSEVLPLPGAVRHRLLCEDDPAVRLELIAATLADKH